MTKKNIEEIVVCLFDGDYHLGFAALANSLSEAGFQGLIFVGYRTSIPTWVDQLQQTEKNTFILSDAIAIRFQQVNPPMHFGYYKPFFLKDTFKEFPFAKRVYFFDVDILVIAPWSMFTNWLKKGVCLCLDNAFPFLHHSHPWRADWLELASCANTMINPISYYFNSGFLAVERNSIVLLERWVCITQKYMEGGGDVTCFTKDPYRSFKGDQDLLNAAITSSADVDINIMGPEAMGFSLPATLMLHAIGETKPWNKSFLHFLLLYGHKPSNAEKNFLHFCRYPINVFSAKNYWVKKTDLRLASFLGRFIG